MNDLLIVRMSDRSKERYTKRRDRSPIGANFGIIAGAAIGFMVVHRIYPESSTAPAIGAIIGLVIGVAGGGLLGRFLKPKSARHRKPRPDLYDGLPFSNEEEEDDQEQHTA